MTRKHAKSFVFDADVSALSVGLKRQFGQNNANLRHVQEILGHRSLVTTERTCGVTITELKEAHRRFYPREKAARQPRSPW